MFNFKKFSELIPYHKKYVKYLKKSSHLVFLSVEKSRESASRKFKKLSLELDEFYEVYERAIFESLVESKPKLLNERTNDYEDWNKVFGDNFDKVPEGSRGGLVCAVEEAGGIYRFSPEYYDPNLTDKMF